MFSINHTFLKFDSKEGGDKRHMLFHLSKHGDTVLRIEGKCIGKLKFWALFPTSTRKLLSLGGGGNNCMNIYDQFCNLLKINVPGEVRAVINIEISIEFS